MEDAVVLPAEITQRENQTEQALVEQAKTDAATFGILYERYVMQVYHYLRTRVETEEDAKDLTQQVFLKDILLKGDWTLLFSLPFRHQVQNSLQISFPNE